MQSPTPMVIVDFVRLGAVIRLTRLCRFLAQKLGRIPVGGGIISVEAAVVLDLSSCMFSSGKGRTDGRVIQ